MVTTARDGGGVCVVNEDRRDDGRGGDAWTDGAGVGARAARARASFLRSDARAGARGGDGTTRVGGD